MNSDVSVIAFFSARTTPTAGGPPGPCARTNFGVPASASAVSRRASRRNLIIEPLEPARAASGSWSVIAWEQASGPAPGQVPLAQCFRAAGPLQHRQPLLPLRGRMPGVDRGEVRGCERDVRGGGILADVADVAGFRN